MTVSAEHMAKERVLVDTDVFSYIFRNDTRAEFFQPYLVHRTLAISFMSVGELYFGAYKNDWGSKNLLRLEHQLKNYVVIPYDSRVVQRWAQIKSDREKLGHQIGHADAWHAACALVNDCALATNNAKDFEDIPGLTIIGPALA